MSQKQQTMDASEHLGLVLGDHKALFLQLIKNFETKVAQLKQAYPNQMDASSVCCLINGVQAREWDPLNIFQDTATYEAWTQGLLEQLTHAPLKPYFNIVNNMGSLYMKREWVVDPKENYTSLGISEKVGARVHTICRSDLDRHLHDHPWANSSFLLDGGYFELVPSAQMQLEALYEGAHASDYTRQRADEIQARYQENSSMQECVKALWRERGQWIIRLAPTRHRLILPYQGASATSLFMTLGKEQEWGFYTHEGKVHHQAYLNINP